MNTAGKRVALGHPLEHDWRADVAAALEARVTAIGAALRHLDDVHAIFETDRDQPAATELRNTAGLLRERANGYADLARSLRADERDGPPALLAAATTTRRPT